MFPPGVYRCGEECGGGPGTDIDVPDPGTADYPGECCADLAATLYLTPFVDQNQFPPGINCTCFQDSVELNFNAAQSTPGVLEVWTGTHTYCDVVYNFTLKCIQPFGACNLRLSIANEAGGTPPYTVADGECSPAGDEPPTNTSASSWSWEITGSTGNCCQIAWTGFTILWTLTK